MDKLSVIYDAVRKIWMKRERIDDGAAFASYIRSLKRDTLLESAKKFGTPQYILDKESVRERAEFFIKTFKKHIPNSRFFYAFKCNDFPLLIKTVKEAGFNADVAGLFELQLALKLGFDRIVFTGPGKNEEELELALKHDDKVIINIDNLDELLRLKDIIKKKNINKTIMVGVRVNPDSSITKTWSKFGIELENLKDFMKILSEEPNLRLAGLHFHCSWNQTPERYVENITLIGNYLKANFSNEELKSLKFLDIGGGFCPEGIATLTKSSQKGDLMSLLNDIEGVPLKEADPSSFGVDEMEPLEYFAREIASCLNKHIFPLNPSIEIYYEPGRFIATHPTSILLEVVSEKKDCVIVDGGINLVGDYRFEEYSFAPIVNLSNPSLKLKRKTIYGPLCDPSDFWGYSYFGKEIKKGDILAVLHQGAYTFSCCWRFIKPTARYVVFDKKGLFLGKERETFEERYTSCRLE